MSPRRTLATAGRVLAQLRHDKRTVALIIVVPIALETLLKWVYNSTPQVFNQIGLPLLGIFPLITMFLVTSVATLRERTTGTLERLLAMPMGKVDLILGYQLGFGLMAVIQSLAATSVAVWLLGLEVAGPLWSAMLVSVLVAELGTALGLAVSAFAKTEFQAVQFMPAIVTPQLLLCGLLAPRDSMQTALRWLSDVLPMSYAVDAMKAITVEATVSGTTWRNMVIIAAFCAGGLVLGSATLRRRSE